MNTSTKRKLLRLADFIEQLPRKAFKMDQWVQDPKGFWDSEQTDYEIGKENVHTCGTACCIGGWYLINKGYHIDSFGDAFKKNDKGNARDAFVVAQEEIGLSYYEAERLFLANYWPGYKEGYYSDTLDRYVDGKQTKFKETPKGAAKRIRHFVATGE